MIAGVQVIDEIWKTYYTYWEEKRFQIPLWGGSGPRSGAILEKEEHIL